MPRRKNVLTLHRLNFFLNFCRNNFPGLKKQVLHNFECLWALQSAKIIWQNQSLKECKIFFIQGGKLVSAKIWKITSCNFWGDVKTASHFSFTTKEMCGLKVVKNSYFDVYLSYLHMKQIWRKSEVWASAIKLKSSLLILYSIAFPIATAKAAPVLCFFNIYRVSH